MPKDGHSTSEYEDAYATSDPDGLPFRAAVADGATESAYSGSWARRLTGAYASSGDLAAGLADLREGFHRISRRGHLPWYLREKSEEGAHAAFAGLEISSGDAGRMWAGQAVGDCCVLHVRAGELLQSWPLSDPAEFSSTPHLVSSRATPGERALLQASGRWEPGDRFILATDALAAWLLEHGKAPDSSGQTDETPDATPEDGPAAARPFSDAAREIAATGFDDVVTQARREGTMRNDDVTAVVIDV